MAMGENPNAVRIASREATAGVSGVTRTPKQADNGEVGALVVPRPLRESAGPNASEAECSAVNLRRSDAVSGSAKPLPLRRRQHPEPECDERARSEPAERVRWPGFGHPIPPGERRGVKVPFVRLSPNPRRELTSPKPAPSSQLGPS